MHLGTGEDLRPLAVGAEHERLTGERVHGVGAGIWWFLLLPSVSTASLLDLRLRGPGDWLRNAHVAGLACKHPDLLVEQSRKKQVSPCGLLRR